MNFYPLYCLPDNCVSSRNMYGVTVYENYCSSVHIVAVTFVLYIQLMHGLWIMCSKQF